MTGVPLSPTEGAGFDPNTPGHWMWMDHEGNPCPRWDDCTRELMVCLPCGHWFNLSARASNCAKPDDRRHRCWGLSGEPPSITTGVNPCGGAYSILCCTPTRVNRKNGPPCGWHGYLKAGILTP